MSKPMPIVNPPADHNEATFAEVELASFVQRLERLQEEIDVLNGDKKEVFKEAKSIGLEPDKIRTVIRRRRMDPDALAESDDLIRLYESALNKQLGPVQPKDEK